MSENRQSGFRPISAAMIFLSFFAIFGATQATLKDGADALGFSPEFRNQLAESESNPTGI